MNSRERILAIAVGALVVVMVAYFIGSSALQKLSQRQSVLRNLQQERNQQTFTLKAAAKATRDLADFQRRSLPQDREQATALYQGWLLDQVEELGFTDPSVRPTELRRRSGYFDRMTFTVDAEVDMRQLAEFLAAFYASGDLHRINNLSIKPIPDSRQMDVIIVIEALSLPSSQREAVGNLKSDRLTPEALADAQRAVLDRSMFFPANVPPRLEAFENQRVVQGETLRLPIVASDADPWDSMEFALGDSEISGIKLVPRNRGEALLEWRAEELGEFTVQVLVRDDGLPSRSDAASFQITVVEPPPPPVQEPTDPRRVLGFDDATQTFLVGTTARGELRQAWFNVRTRGDMLKLNVGDSLRIGSIIGDLAQISDNYVEIHTDAGTQRILIGQSLTQGVLTPPTDQQADSQS